MYQDDNNFHTATKLIRLRVLPITSQLTYFLQRCDHKRGK